MLNFWEPSIQSTRLSREQFASALRHGRGSVVMDVRDHGMEGVDDLVLAALERQKADDKEAYDLGYYAVAICTEARSPALAGVALWLYHICPCSICCRHAVGMLLEWGCLPADIAEEARYDATNELRKLLCTQP